MYAIDTPPPTVSGSLHVGHVFSFIGAEPSSDWISGCAAFDERGFVLTDRQLPESAVTRSSGALPFETSVPGVFAAGAASATASNPMDAYAKTVKKHHMAPKHHKHHVMKHKHHTKHMKRVARKKPAGM